MSDDWKKKNRRRHLKNLRKVQKNKRFSAKVSPRSRTAAKSGSFLVTMGLILSAVVLVVLLSSLFFQYDGGFSGISGKKSERESIPVVEPGTVEVRVLNGCGTPGASRLMTNRLRDLRFDVVSAENAANFDYLYTQVINHSGRPEIGRAVAEALNCKLLSDKADNLALVDVTVILGKDWQNFLSDTTRAEVKEESGLKKYYSRVKSLLGK
jgi:hypothetical protein